MPKNCLLVQYYVTQETPVPLPGPSFPLSATRDWPASPRTPSTPMTPMFNAAEPLHGVREIPNEKEYEMQVIALRKELGHSNSEEDMAQSPSGESIYEAEKRLSKLPPLGDEVLLEFGRPPLKEGLRLWSEGFGKRACVYGMFFPKFLLCCFLY